MVDIIPGNSRRSVRCERVLIGFRGDQHFQGPLAVVRDGGIFGISTLRIWQREDWREERLFELRKKTNKKRGKIMIWERKEVDAPWRRAPADFLCVSLALIRFLKMPLRCYARGADKAVARSRIPL